MFLPRIAMLAALASTAAAASTSGRASVEWVTSTLRAEPGKPLHTAIRMTHDEGWHSYWCNPGEAGMPTKAEWKLPPGWKTDGLELPAPVRFQTGGLAGYGYEGTVLIPVTVTPPADFTGAARLTVTLGWLACSEDGCVPGERELHLDIHAGTPAPTGDAPAIQQALGKLPVTPEGVRLDVDEASGGLVLTLRGAAKLVADPATCHIFPATPEVLNPQDVLRFREQGGDWVAEAALGEYAAKPVRQLELVLQGPSLARPLRVVWSAR